MQISSIRSFSVLLFSVAAVTEFAACGSAKPAGKTNTVAQKVGTGGGTVKLANNVTLVIPAGALDKETTIGVTSSATSPTGYELDSLRYQFSPEGLTFQQPVTVRLQLLQERAGQGLYWSKAAGVSGYDLLPSTVQTADDKTYLEGQTTHFSEAFIGRSTAPNGNSGPSGASTPACGTGETTCGGACVNLADSEAHCGACDNACTGSATCQESVCRTTVTVSVYVGPSDAENPVTVAVAARKIGNTWSALTVGARDATDHVAMSFTTTDSTYEVMVGCTDIVETLPHAKYGYHLKKSSTANVIALVCGNPPKPGETPRETVTINATGLPASNLQAIAAGADGDSEYSLVTAGAATFFLNVSDDNNWAALVQFYDDTVAKWGILRNRTSATSGFSSANFLQSSTTTISFDFASEDTSVETNSGLSVFGYTSQGEFDDFSLSGESLFSYSLDTNTYSVETQTLSGLQSGEGHHLIQSFVNADGEYWAVDARFSSSPSELSISMPRALGAIFEQESETISETQYGYTQVSGLRAADTTIFVSEGHGGMSTRWEVEFDRAAVAATENTLRVPNLVGVPGSNQNLFRAPTNEESYVSVTQKFDQGAAGNFSSRTVTTSRGLNIGGK